MSADNSTPDPRFLTAEVDGKRFKYNRRTEQFTRLDKPKQHRKPITTDTELRALKGESVEYELRVAGCRGLRVRVSPLSHVSFYHRYASPVTKRLRKLNLGIYIKDKGAPGKLGMSLAQAKDCWQRNRDLIGRGIDPRDEQDRVRQEQAQENRRREVRSGHTVAKLVNAYVYGFDVSRAKGGKRSRVAGIEGQLKTWENVQRILEKDLVAAYGDRSAFDIGKADVEALVEDMRHEDRPVASNRLLSAISACYTWANRSKWPGKSEPISHNPASGVDRVGETRRTRTLRNPELAVLVTKLPDVFDAPVADFLLFLLLSGLRISEAAAIRWSDIYQGELHIADTKNATDHTVYLSDFAMEIIERQPRESEYVWPRSGGRHIDPRRVANLLADHMQDIGLDKFTPHDFRRAIASWVAGNKGGKEVRDRVLNHVVGSGVDAIYNRHEYDDEARHQWQQWADHLRSLSAPEVSSIKETRSA